VEVIDGTPLQDEERVLRVYLKSLQGNIPPNAFELSSTDKKEGNRLSVWACSLTTCAQALVLMNKNSDFFAACSLQVEHIRNLRLDVMPDDFQNIDTIWHILHDDTRPGALGHAAIIGLRQTCLNPVHRKDLRLKLAEIAEKILEA